MKGDLTRSIFNKLNKAATNSVGLFMAYLNAGYGANLSKIEYEFSKIKAGRKIDNKEIKEARDKFNKLVYKLKKDGLIKKKGRGAKAVYSITNRGLKKLENLKEKKNDLSFPKVDYPEPKGKIIILISFDIPERNRRKRDWLRKVLVYLKFKQIHRSVFVGKGKLPEEFIDDLERLQLNSFVEIVKIGKSGTLRKVID